MKQAIFSFALLALMFGIPAAHGLSGKDFGAAVSGLAQSYPGAVADHTQMMKGGPQ